ncbi:MAG: hypothetical protein ACM30G_04765 [Micromonosporaceae bacterium]
MPIEDVLNREYKRDPDGQFASGGSDDDDPGVGEVDEGDEGYGRDPNGVSYTENDVDLETGEPKFSEAYRAKYGPVTSESVHDTVDGRPIAVVQTQKGPFLHIADDSRGTKQREVIQELTKREARDLGDGVFAVYSGEKQSFTSSGVSVAPAGPDPTRDGVKVTWRNGKETTFAGEAGNDAAFELQESLSISGKER